MNRKCNYCYQTFEDEERLFCPFCGEILDPELKLAVDFHRIHQEYQGTKKRDMAVLKREAIEKSKPAPPPVKITIQSTNHKSKQKKKQQKKKTSAKQKKQQTKAPLQSSSAVIPFILLFAAAAYFLFFR